MWECRTPSSRISWICAAPAPRADQSCSLNRDASGRKFVSHMCLPGRTGINENEIFVMKEIKHRRQVARHRDARGLPARAVEELVFGIERRSEDAVDAPLELVPLAGIAFDHRAAVAREYVEGRFEDVLLRDRVAARRNVEQEHRHGIAAPFDVDDRAV